jgi:hypothetical protein
MRAKLLFAILVVTLFFTVLALPTPAHAASNDCADFSSLSGPRIGARIDGVSGTFEPGDFVTITITPIGNTTGTWRIINNGFGSVTFAGPASIPGTLTFLVTGPLPIGSDGIGFYVDSVGGDETYDVNATCTDAPAAGTTYTGPGIPNSFQLRTITCDVAVFTAPGGSPVGNDRIIAGQTWYVNPTSVNAATGEAWTEIFVSGRINGYIPTRCVQ